MDESARPSRRRSRAKPMDWGERPCPLSLSHAPGEQAAHARKDDRLAHAISIKKHNHAGARLVLCPFRERRRGLCVCAGTDVYSAAWRKFPSCSEYTFTCRGGPIRTGWKNTAAPIVHSSDRAISLPMLEMPGELDTHMLPNAIAVVMALNITALVSVDCSRPVFPARHAMM